MLEAGNWDKFNLKRLEKLIFEKRCAGNYAVFDWDFTCVFYDTQDNLLDFQIRNLEFKMNPEEFSKAIRFETPQDSPTNVCNLAGKKLTSKELAADVDTAYKFIFTHCEKFAGNGSLENILQTEMYKNFSTKLLLLTKAVASVSETDIAELASTGFTLQEYKILAEKAIDFALQEKIHLLKLRSSDLEQGHCGICETELRRGIRLQPEMQNLIKILNKNGIETYICSASQKENVEVFASSSKYGYNIKPQNVFARRRFFDKNGKLTLKRNLNFGFPHRQGKTKTIEDFIMQKHEGKPPVLIAGDSDGDYYMMEHFEKTALLLIFNRNPPKNAKISKYLEKGLKLKQENCQNANILVQERNYKTGLFSN